MTALWFLAGGAIGTLMVLTIAWSVAALRPERPVHAIMLFGGGAMLRWTLAAGGLMLAWRRGILPGLAALVGFWLGRWAVTYLLSSRTAASQRRRHGVSGDSSYDH